jgi:hypothetical protein
MSIGTVLIESSLLLGFVLLAFQHYRQACVRGTTEGSVAHPRGHIESEEVGRGAGFRLAADGPFDLLRSLTFVQQDIGYRRRSGPYSSVNIGR